jgi:hypothetical protein
MNTRVVLRTTAVRLAKSHIDDSPFRRIIITAGSLSRDASSCRPFGCDRPSSILQQQPSFSHLLEQSGIEFGAHKYDEARPIKPHKQCNGRVQTAVGRIEVRKVPEVDSQQIGESNPSGYSDHSSRQRAQEFGVCWPQKDKSSTSTTVNAVITTAQP